jgi:hypothetical protein
MSDSTIFLHLAIGFICGILWGLLLAAKGLGNNAQPFLFTLTTPLISLTIKAGNECTKEPTQDS